MTIFQNTHEGLTNGTVIAANGSNTGGASGNAYTASAILGTGSLTASNLHPAHNNMAIYIVSNGTGDRARMQIDFTATDLVTLRFYLYWEEAPGVAVAFARIMGTDNAGMSSLQLNASGVLQATSKTGTIKTFAAAHTFPNLYRYEFAIQKVTGGTTDGQVKVSYFLGDSTTAIETFEATGGTGTNLGTLQAFRAYIGGIDTNAKIKAHLDSVKLDNTSYALLGPGAATASPPSLSVTTYTDRIVVVSTAAAGAGGTVSVTASPAPLATPAPGIFVFARQASTGADFTETITATETPSGLTNSTTVNIPKISTSSQVNVMAPRTPIGPFPTTTWS